MGFDDLDITKNIKIIETVKSNLLTQVALLYENMLSSNSDSEARLEIMSQIIIDSYLLSRKLSIDFSVLDKKIKNQLKLNILEEDTLYADYKELIQYIDKKR